MQPSLTRAAYRVRSAIGKRLFAALTVFGVLFFNTTDSFFASEALTHIRPAYSAQESLPFATEAQQKAAEQAVRSLALISALRQASASIGSLTATRLALSESTHLLALTATALPVLLMTFPTQDTQTSMTSTAQIFVPSGTLSTQVQKALAAKDAIELRAGILSRMELLAKEASELLIATTDPPLNEQEERLAVLSDQLAAINGYFDILEDFDETWSEPEQASVRLEELTRLDPDNPRILMSLAEVHLLLDRPHEAMLAVNHALRMEPSLARAFYIRGLIQLRLRFASLAVADFGRALSLGDTRASWLLARAAALRIEHDYDPMCQDLYQACMLDDCAGLVEVRKQNLCLESER